MSMRESNKCVICLKNFNYSIEDDSRTEEHVFPKSWYPKSTPNDLKKWKVPSCKKSIVNIAVTSKVY